MTFDEIVAGIDRHLRLRAESRQRRAVNEDRERLGVSFAWPRDTDLTPEQMTIAAVGDRAAAASSPAPDAGRTVEATALHAPRLQQVDAQLPRGDAPVLGWTKRQMREHEAAMRQRGECGDGHASIDWDEWAR